MVAVSLDRKSTRLNSSHTLISYAVFCLKKKNRHVRSEEHTSELQSHSHLVCSLLLEKNNASVCPVCQTDLQTCFVVVLVTMRYISLDHVFFLKVGAPTDIYTLPLQDSLPI